MIDRSKILQPSEILSVLQSLSGVGMRPSKNRELNRIIFLLAGCYGLRVSEICGLNIAEVHPLGDSPTLTVKRETTKGKKSWGRTRVIPLDLDSGALEHIRAWHAKRVKETDWDVDAPFVCSVTRNCYGQRMERSLVAKRWRTAIKVLPKDRVKQLSIHKGRHTHVSLAVARYGVAIAKELAGHASISSTNAYVHPFLLGPLPSLFDFEGSTAEHPGHAPKP